MCGDGEGGDGPDIKTFTFVSVCAGLSDVHERIRNVCVKQLAPLKIPGLIRLKLNYNAFRNNQSLVTLLLTSIGDDVALSIGVAPDEIVDREFQEVTRRRRLLQESAGVNFAFNLQTTSAENTQSAGGRLDALLVTGGFDLTKTVAALQANCPDCASAEDLANLAAAGGTPVPTTSQPGGTTFPPGDLSGASPSSVSLALTLLAAALIKLL